MTPAPSCRSAAPWTWCVTWIQRGGRRPWLGSGTRPRSRLRPWGRTLPHARWACLWVWSLPVRVYRAVCEGGRPPACRCVDACVWTPIRRGGHFAVANSHAPRHALMVCEWRHPLHSFFPPPRRWWSKTWCLWAICRATPAGCASRWWGSCDWHSREVQLAQGPLLPQVQGLLGQVRGAPPPPPSAPLPWSPALQPSRQHRPSPLRSLTPRCQYLIGSPPGPSPLGLAQCHPLHPGPSSLGLAQCHPLRWPTLSLPPWPSGKVRA